MMSTLLHMALRVPAAFAQGTTLTTGQFNVNGTAFTMSGIFTNLSTVLLGSIVPVCAAVFLTGAFLFTASFGKDNLKTTGKGMMIGAIIGLALVFGARAILGLTIYFIYGDSI